MQTFQVKMHICVCGADLPWRCDMTRSLINRVIPCHEVCDKAITQHIIPDLIIERPFSSTLSGEHLSLPINQIELFSLSLKPPEIHGHPHPCLTKAHKPHLHPKALWLAANPKPCTASIHFSFHSFVLFQFRKHCFIGIQKRPPLSLEWRILKRNFIWLD